jgi:hypothetical protein
LHAAAPVILPQKSIFDLGINAMEPLLGPISSFLISSEFFFQVRDPIFGGAQLMRKLLRHIQRVSAVFLGDTSRLFDQLQNRMAGLIELIRIIRPGAFRSPRKWDYIRLRATTTDLTVHLTLPLDLGQSYRRLRF